MTIFLITMAALAAPIRDVPGHPGAVAWSADGMRAACITDDDIVVVDALTGEQQALGQAGEFVDWAPADDLLVVFDAHLFRVDPATSESVPIATPHPVSYARWFTPDHSVVAIHATSEPTRIGVVTGFRITRIDPLGTQELGYWDPVLPRRATDYDAISGWQAATFHPIDHTFTAPVYQDPPAVPPSVVYRAIDPATGEIFVRLHVYGDRATLPASWAPDGYRLAFADDEGHLVWWDARTKTLEEPDLGGITGQFPAWSPHGEVLFFGGWLVDTTGQRIRRITRDKHAIGTWSPDGSRIAVQSRGRVRIFEVGPPAPDTTDPVERLSSLAELLIDRLIDEPTYQSRRSRILDAEGHAPPDPDELNTPGVSR